MTQNDLLCTILDAAKDSALTMHNGGYLRAGADQHLLRTVTRFQARRRADRRIFALCLQPDPCCGGAQIIGYGAPPPGPQACALCPAIDSPRRPGARHWARRSPNLPCGATRQAGTVNPRRSAAFAEVRRCRQGDKPFCLGRVVICRPHGEMNPPCPRQTALTSNSSPAPGSMITSPASWP
jgi:hypothetical protein